MKLDRTDRTILAELQRDGRLSNRELADKVHLSESACLRRVRALEEAGVIDRYAALVSQSKVGLPGNVFVSITLNRQEQADLAAFEEAVKRVPEVMECYLMTGAQDYLVRVVVSDPASIPALIETLRARRAAFTSHGIASNPATAAPSGVLEGIASPSGAA